MNKSLKRSLQIGGPILALMIVGAIVGPPEEESLTDEGPSATAVTSDPVEQEATPVEQEADPVEQELETAILDTDSDDEVIDLSVWAGRACIEHTRARMQFVTDNEVSFGPNPRVRAISQIRYSVQSSMRGLNNRGEMFLSTFTCEVRYLLEDDGENADHPLNWELVNWE